MKEKKIIAFDFDGVIASYDGWKGIAIFGKPNREVIKVMNGLHDKGCRVIIWTTRQETPKLRAWLKKNKVRHDGINTNSHNPPNTSAKPVYHAFVDDRAVNYKPGVDLQKELNKILDKKL